jgi:WD40 repeat protein
MHVRHCVLVRLTYWAGIGLFLLAFAGLSAAKEPLTLQGDDLKGGVHRLAFSADGKTLAISCGDRIGLYDVAEGKKLATTFEEGIDGTNGLAFSPDGKLLVASQGQYVFVLEVATGKTKHMLKFDRDEAPGNIAISPDGKTLALAGKQHAATLIDLENYRELAKLEDQKEIIALAFDKTGESLATASRFGTTVIWDVNKREKLKTLDQSHNSGMGSMAYSQDGNTVVTNGSFKGSGLVRVWDVEKGEPRWTYENPKNGVRLLNGIRSLALSPDGKMLVFITDGGFVRFIADLDKGGEIETALELRINDKGRSIAFSPDGKLIAVAGEKIVKIGAVPEKKKE